MSDDIWEEQLSHDLERRVRDLDDVAFSLTDVRGRALSIRRRRRLTAIGVVLAALAVALPVALLTAPGSTRSDAPPVTTTSLGPSPTPGTASPPVASVSGRRLTRTDGTTLQLPQRFQEVALLGDGVAGVGDIPGGGLSVSVIDTAGRTILSSVSDTGIATDVAGTTVAWVVGGEMMVAGPDGASQSLGAVAATAVPITVTGTCHPVSVGGDGTPVPSGPGDCQVWFDAGAGSGDSARIIDETGTVSGVGFTSVTRLQDAGENGVLAVSVQGPTGAACSEVQDRDGARLARTCAFSLGRFSPDGRHVVGIVPGIDGNGSTSVAILDTATLRQVARYEVPDGFVGQAVWVDDESLAVTSYDGGHWWCDTLATDDAVDAAGGRIGPFPGDDVTPGVLLADAS